SDHRVAQPHFGDGGRQRQGGQLRSAVTLCHGRAAGRWWRVRQQGRRTPGAPGQFGDTSAKLAVELRGTDLRQDDDGRNGLLVLLADVAERGDPVLDLGFTGLVRRQTFLDERGGVQRLVEL